MSWNFKVLLKSASDENIKLPINFDIMFWEFYPNINFRIKKFTSGNSLFSKIYFELKCRENEKKNPRKKFTSGENFRTKNLFWSEMPKNRQKNFSRVFQIFREFSYFNFSPEVDLRKTSKFQEILANTSTFLQKIFAKNFRESVACPRYSRWIPCRKIKQHFSWKNRLT